MLQRAGSPRGSTERIPWASTVNSCFCSFSPVLPLRAHFRAWLDDDQGCTPLSIISTHTRPSLLVPDFAWTLGRCCDGRELRESGTRERGSFDSRSDDRDHSDRWRRWHWQHWHSPWSRSILRPSATAFHEERIPTTSPRLRTFLTDNALPISGFVKVRFRSWTRRHPKRLRKSYLWLILNILSR